MLIGYFKCEFEISNNLCTSLVDFFEISDWRMRFCIKHYLDGVEVSCAKACWLEGLMVQVSGRHRYKKEVD